MSLLLLAAALSAAPARAQGADVIGRAKTYGILILAYDVDVNWRRDLGRLAAKLKGHPVETVDRAEDAISVQRAVDRLLAKRVTKIVAVPIETVSESARLDNTRYMFGVRAEPVLDVPGPSKDVLKLKPLKPAKSADPHPEPRLKLPKDRDHVSGLAVGGGDSTLKRIRSAVPLNLAPALDKSPLLVEILADRAKALSTAPARETLVLAGVAPRSEAALAAWKTAAQDIAEKVGAKAGFRKATSVAVRDGVRSDQAEKDGGDLAKTFRALRREGRVDVVPLSPDASRVDELLKKVFGGPFDYRWNGAGIAGDRRLFDWIKASAETAAALPDGRQFKDAARLAAPGGLR